MRALIAIPLFALLSGCATPTPPGPPITIDPPAKCSSERQCDAMWAEAMVQAPIISGMKIQTATDSFMQTYNPTGFDRLGATVRRMPLPDGTTAIEATFSCRYNCGDLAARAVNLFTAKVKAAGIPFATHQPASTSGTFKSEPLSESAYKEQQIRELTRQNLPYEEYQKRYRQIMGE